MCYNTKARFKCMEHVSHSQAKNSTLDVTVWENVKRQCNHTMLIIHPVFILKVEYIIYHTREIIPALGAAI